MLPGPHHHSVSYTKPFTVCGSAAEWRGRFSCRCAIDFCCMVRNSGQHTKRGDRGGCIYRSL